MWQHRWYTVPPFALGYLYANKHLDLQPPWQPDRLTKQWELIHPGTCSLKLFIVNPKAATTNSHFSWTNQLSMREKLQMIASGSGDTCAWLLGAHHDQPARTERGKGKHGLWWQIWVSNPSAAFKAGLILDMAPNALGLSFLLCYVEILILIL